MKALKNTLLTLALALVGCVPVSGAMDAGGGGDGGADGGKLDAALQAKFTALYADYMQECKNCHAPKAPGFDPNLTEKTLDFTTAATAYMTLTTGKAAGLKGNQAGCNGSPFLRVGAPEKSLILASIDRTARNLYDDPMFTMCNKDTISDMTLKAGDPTPAFVAALTQWIKDGAGNN